MKDPRTQAQLAEDLFRLTQVIQSSILRHPETGRLYLRGAPNDSAQQDALGRILRSANTWGVKP